MTPNENKIHVKKIREKIRKIFVAAQEQFGHQKLTEKCKKLHKSSDEEIFLQEFTTALKYTFVYQEKHAVDNILSFVSKYLGLFYIGIPDQNTSSSTIDEIAPFISRILEFLFKCHKASCPDARLRCLQLLCKILSGMPENSLISDEVWSKLKETVLSRLQDKYPPVRAQAVLTARMLQDPKNENCEIIKALIFHFNDPSSSVRRNAVTLIALNKMTIPHVLARTRDVNDNVRRNTYLVFSKIKVLNLPIKYRVTILDRGLQDRSEIVRKCIEQILIINWLETFNKNVIKFLEALDVVNCSEIAIKAVESILKTQSVEEIMKQLPVDEETRLIPKEKLSPEAVMLWRCLAHHFWNEGNEEELEAFLPNLTVLCDHIRGFYKLEEPPNISLNEEEQWTQVKEKEVLMHLLQLLRVFDLGDEMGRLKLKELIVDMLISLRISNNQTKPLIELLVLVVPSKDALMQELTEVISEIREPLRTVVSQISQKEKLERDLKASDLKLTLNELRELEYEAVSNKKYAEAQKLKDQIEATEAELKAFVEQPATLTQEVREEISDPVSLCKCLSILIEMIKCSHVKVLTPTLRNLKENFLNQCMTSRDLLTQSLAIEACAQFCILDKELAKENLIRFLLMISEDADNEINIPSLKGVFDILQTHGIECFEHLNQSEGIEEEKRDSRGKKRTLMTKDGSFHGDSPLYDEANESFTEVECLKNLKSLLNCKTNDDLKAVAYEGLCKLLLSGVIDSPSVLSRIIIKGFSPIIDCEKEDFIRQTFMVFFPIFASRTPRSQEMIEAAFLPTIRAIFNAPLGSPDADINPKNVITFLIDHTKPDINQFTAKTLHLHNNLAMTICHEVYQELRDPNESGSLVPIYLKSLNQLNVSLESLSFVQQLRTMTGKIEKKLKETSSIRWLYAFMKKIEEKSLTVTSSVENTLMTTRDSRASKQAATAEESFLSPSTPKAKRDTKSNLNSLNELNESLAGSENSDFSGSPEKISLGVVPESPEISD